MLNSSKGFMILKVNKNSSILKIRQSNSVNVCIRMYLQFSGVFSLFVCSSNTAVFFRYFTPLHFFCLESLYVCTYLLYTLQFTTNLSQFLKTLFFLLLYLFYLNTSYFYKAIMIWYIKICSHKINTTFFHLSIICVLCNY